jgi:hypothetical protein
MTSSKVLERLIEFAPPILAAHTGVRARCIAATAVGCDVLRAFDIPAEPYPVVIELANAAFIAAAKRGADQVTAVARGGHILVMGEPSPGGWPGHLVIHVRAYGVLVDLDFQQFRRAEQQINADAAEVFPWPSGTTTRVFTNADGARLVIEATDDHTYERSPDWTALNRRRPMVAALIRAIRKGRL